MFSENYTVYETMSNILVEPKGPHDVTIWHILFGCRNSKAICTHAQGLMRRPICNTYCFSTATMVSWKRLIVTLYVHCQYCLILRAKQIFIFIFWKATIFSDMCKWIFFDEHILNYESYFFDPSEYLTEVTLFFSLI